MEINSDANFSLQNILIKIASHTNGNEFLFDFGNCKLKVIRGMNPRFMEGFHFLGSYVSERRAGMIEFSLPYKVESYEQGLAMISYYLSDAHFEIRPDWLDEGLALENHLPWYQEIEVFDAAIATIHRDWFRVLVKQIKMLIPTSSDVDLTRFSFDGDILKVTCNKETFVVKGLGEAWKKTGTVKTKSLELLPERIPNGDIRLYIWKNRLHIDNKVFKLEP